MTGELARRRPPPGHRRRRLHRQRAGAPGPRPPRRRAGDGARQADLRRQPGEPRGRRAGPGAGRPLRVRPGRHRRPRGRRAAGRAASTRSSTSPPRPTSTGRSSIPRRSCGRASSGSTCCSRPCAARRSARGPANDRRPRASSRSAPTRCTARSRTAGASRRTPSSRAARTPPPRPPSELLVRAYHVTYGLDVVITRGSNTYGPFQHPEKLIPLFVTNALAGEPLPMYGDGMQVRDWLFVADHAGGHRVRAAPRRVGRGVQPGRRERAAEPRGHRPAAGGDGPRLVARPLGAGSAGARPPVRHGRLEGRVARLAGARSRSSRACPTPSPGTASTATGSRPPDPATGTPTTRASTATDSPPGRR